MTHIEHNITYAGKEIKNLITNDTIEVAYPSQYQGIDRVYKMKTFTADYDARVVSVQWYKLLRDSNGVVVENRKTDMGTFSSHPSEWDSFQTAVALVPKFIEKTILNSMFRRLEEFDGNLSTGKGNKLFLPDGTPITPIEFALSATPPTDDEVADGSISIQLISTHSEAISWSVNGGDFTAVQPTGLAGNVYQVQLKYSKVGASGKSYDVFSVVKSIHV